MTKLILILAIIAAVYVLISSLKFLRVILTLVFGLVYWPMNSLYAIVQKWHWSYKNKDPIGFYCSLPFYWIVVVVTFIIAVPYEFVVATELH